MTDQPLILYETPTDKVARIVLNRPETRNAQNTALLYELNDAFDRAAHDEDVSVIILAANGPHFSSGHDLREKDSKENMYNHVTVGTWSGFTQPGQEGMYAREKEVFLGFSERWRNIPKPTIAAVQGKCISGGLMLAWPCDIIVASDDATFTDNTVSLGICGVEYFAHPWEYGPRKAKEHLFTSDPLPADEALRLGMVNHVVGRNKLDDFVLDMASRIATKPLFALKATKEAVNAAQDAQGRQTVFQMAFAMHHMLHSHAMHLHGIPIDPDGVAPVVKRGTDRFDQAR